MTLCGIRTCPSFSCVLHSLSHELTPAHFPLLLLVLPLLLLLTTTIRWQRLAMLPGIINNHHHHRQQQQQFHEAQVTWRPECAGKFRGNLAFRVDGRFPAQVSMVGEAVDTGGRRGNGKGRKGESREGRRRTRGPASGVGSGVGRSSSGGSGGGGVERRRSLSREASRGLEAYTSVRRGMGTREQLSLSHGCE